MAIHKTVLNAAGLRDGSGSAVEGRADVFDMTQAAEEAVLRPNDAGAWPHELRAALAARIAIQNDERALAEQYAAGAGGFSALANPSNDGAAEGFAEVIAFMDSVSLSPKDVSAADITRLQAAGVSDADIVRLCELNAFLAYQLRVISGLRLMREAYA